MSRNASTAGWSRWLQFNLQAILALVTVAAVACAFYLYAHHETQSLSGDALTVFQQIRQGPDDSVRHGRWIVQDKNERTRVIGYMDGDVPHGTWTAYYENGRKAWQGRCDKGAAVGTWCAWNRDGSLRSRHSRSASDLPKIPPQYTAPIVVTAGMNHGAWDERALKLDPTLRKGPLVAYWPSGQTRVSGQYHRDRAAGEWSYWADDGKLLAEGPMHDGERSGMWRVRDGKGLQDIMFVDNCPIADPQRELALLQAALQSDQPTHQAQAASRLEAFGEVATLYLLDALRRDSPRATQLLALRTLGQIGAPARAALPRIKEFLQSPDVAVKCRAHVAQYRIDEANRDVYLPEMLTAIDATDNQRARLTMLTRLAHDDTQHANVFLDHLVKLATRGGKAQHDAVIDRLVALDPLPITFMQRAMEADPPAARMVICEVAVRAAEDHSPYFALAGTPEHRASLAIIALLQQACDDPDVRVRRLARSSRS